MGAARSGLAPACLIAEPLKDGSKRTQPAAKSDRDWDAGSGIGVGCSGVRVNIREVIGHRAPRKVSVDGRIRQREAGSRAGLECTGHHTDPGQGPAHACLGLVAGTFPPRPKRQALLSAGVAIKIRRFLLAARVGLVGGHRLSGGRPCVRPPAPGGQSARSSAV